MNWKDRIWCNNGHMGIILKYGKLDGWKKSWGFQIKDTRKHAKLFSERYHGYWGQFEIGHYMFRTYWPRGHLQ